MKRELPIDLDALPMDQLRGLYDGAMKEISKRQCPAFLDRLGGACQKDGRDGHTVHVTRAWGYLPNKGGAQREARVTWEFV